MPTFIPAPVIYSSNHHHHANEGKEILAVFASLHILAIVSIIVTLLIAKIRKDDDYDIFEDNMLAWISLGVLFLFDLILLLSNFIYSLL
jgi:hypothetical protein